MPTVYEGKHPGRVRGRPGAAQGGTIVATEWSAYRGEVGANQVITASFDVDGGTFTLSLDAEETANIAWDADEATMKTALEGLTAISDVTVSVANPWNVTFNDGLGERGALVPNNAGLDRGFMTVTVVHPGQLEDEEVASIEVDASAGSYKLIYGGQTTAGIDFDADAAAVDAAFTLLSSVTAVVVTGSGTRKDPFLVDWTALGAGAGQITYDLDTLGNLPVPDARLSAPNSNRE